MSFPCCGVRWDRGAALHIHLDPIGGVAGDMFLAAIVDAWPEYESTALEAIRAAGLPRSWSLALERGYSAGIVGRRFRVAGDPSDHTHATGTFRDIRARLAAAPLAPTVRDRAVDIYHRLAEAEAQIHGTAIDDVHFHEIAGWDSIADIVGAAALIEALGADWSVDALPMGAGRVLSAHGPLPVPAPATALLLRDFWWIDDGFAGERVTPTGAAILAHLGARQDGHRPSGTLVATGHGLGTRETEGLANLLRVLAFSTATRATSTPGVEHGEIGVISFEVDDQIPEDLAVGIDRLRRSDGVLDVSQSTVLGKKGRVAVAIRVLCHPERVEMVADACFLQTTTIGLRWRRERRIVLARSEEMRDGYRMKRVQRPDGAVTVKVASDDLAEETGGQARRAAVRRAVESRGPVDE